MSNNKGKNKLSIVMVLVVVAVLVLGFFAVKNPIMTSIETNKQQKAFERMMNGTATVEDLANLSGLTADELMAAYGITAEDGITANSTAKEFENVLTLAKYCEYMGYTYTEEDFATYKTENGLGEDITLETKDAEVKSGFATYLTEKQAAEAEATEAAAAENDTDVNGEVIAE